jgi:hypothetical protein
MNNSSKTSRILLLTAGVSLLAGFSSHASAEVRMAGSTVAAAPHPDPASGPEPASTKEMAAPEAPPAPEKTSEKPEASVEQVSATTGAETIAPGPEVSTLPVDFAVLESYGILDTMREGALGIDLWDNTRRSTLATLISEQPVMTPYRTLNRLTRRALLTTADARLMSGRSDIQPGQDLLILRLEKLMQLGSYEEAAQLYTANPAEPYHERLARDGMLALLYTGRSPVACLESLSLESRFGQLPFWNDLMAACTALMSDSSKDAFSSDYKPQSKIVEKLIRNDGFRYAVKSQKDLESLSELEKALLIADGRMDYSDFKIRKAGDIAPEAATVLLQDSNLPDNTRFGLLRFAVAKGLRGPDSLADFYKSLGFSNAGTVTSQHIDYPGIKGWRRLAWLYQSLEPAKGKDPVPESLQDNLVAQALALGSEYGPSVLLPFAPYIKNTNPANLPGDSIRTGMKVLLASNTAVSAPWQEKWHTVKTTSASDLLLDTAFDAFEDFSTTSEKPAFGLENTGLNSYQTQIIQVVYEKLDNFQKITQDSPVGAYEKPTDLTLDGNYVMPSNDLLDNLNEAKNDRRLGEMVLLSSLALQGAPLGKLHPELLREVLEGLETVGLTEEARSLTTEVILGL